MTTRQKKQFERAMLLGLLNRLTIPARLLEGHFESPDAAIVLGEQTIGVEVTEIQKSVEERARRAPKDDILQRARRDYEAPGRSPISATFSFNESEDLRQINRAWTGQPFVDIRLP